MNINLIDLIVDIDRLLIIPIPDAVKEMREEFNSSNYQDWFPSLDFRQIENEVLETELANGWSIVQPEDVGALTDGLIITNGEHLFWDSDYAITDWLDIVLNQGRGYYFTSGGELPTDYQKD